ncbi:unnamed protein product [Musa textilis]
MSYQYETSLEIFHVKPFDNGVYVLGLGQAKHPLGSISIDPNPQYVGCFPEVLHGEVSRSQAFTVESIPTSFPMIRMSSTYNTKKVIVLPLTFCTLEAHLRS